MARYLFLTWPGAGNQPPAVGIAQVLVERGHTVIFAGYSNQRPYFTTRDFRFVLLESAAAGWRELPPESMFAVKLNSVWAAAEHLRDVPRLLRAERPDVLVVDCLMFGALAFLEGAELPTFVLVHSAPGALLPPGGSFETVLIEKVNRLRVAARRSPLRTLWEAWERFPSLCTSVRELDPLATAAPVSFDYVGPIFERAPSHRPLPWDTGDCRPLVLVSFSTGPYWDQRSRIDRTLRGLAEGPCQILVTSGGTDVSGIAVPSNARLVRDFPHSLVLPHAAATVTHAGHGTVAFSLLHGVPLVCLPNPAADQPALAARVEALGVGHALDGETADPAEINVAVNDVIHDSRYAANARSVAATIAGSKGSTAAADRLENIVRPKHPAAHEATMQGSSRSSWWTADSGAKRPQFRPQG